MMLLQKAVSKKFIFFMLVICLLFVQSILAGESTHNNHFLRKDTAIREGRAQEVNPRVLALALTAHKRACALGVVKKPYLTIIDYSLPSTTRRLWVVDIVRSKVIYCTHVAHGSGSGDKLAKRFSDIPGSLQTSLGVFVTGKTYQGKHGTSLTLHGLEKGINGNALYRRIVMHSAHYVNFEYLKARGKLGRSWGCPALNTQLAGPIIQTIKEGSLVFSYYPDKHWLAHSKFL